MTVPPIVLHGRVVHVFRCDESSDGRRRVEISLDIMDGSFAYIEMPHDRLLMYEPVSVTITPEIQMYGSKVLKAIRASERP